MTAISTSEKAPILGPDGSPFLVGDPITIGSSNAAVAKIVGGDAGTPLYLSGESAGVVTVSATRLSDGATATMEVEVTSDLGPFTISLGTPEPK